MSADERLTAAAVILRDAVEELMAQEAAAAQGSMDAT